ncbi:MAG: DUF3387 domain-containing protein [Acetobacteraceae bacterium]|nr:DUF3387 domain-containing protein [Acetobacteraceae bacterium]
MPTSLRTYSRASTVAGLPPLADPVNRQPARIRKSCRTYRSIVAAASEEARAIRDEVGFFQTVRAALVKSGAGTGKTTPEWDLTVRQIVSRAVVSTEIIDILCAAGMTTPDISILSDEFLAELKGMERKNLALEALRRLLEGDIRSSSRTNIVEIKAFSERLAAAVARYHNNAITTTEVLDELIGIAKDIRVARARGEKQGLSDEEIAFYDALAENESAVEAWGMTRSRSSPMIWWQA